MARPVFCPCGLNSWARGKDGRFYCTACGAAYVPREPAAATPADQVKGGSET